MKLNRAQFKKILKECICELISEGAFNNVVKENIEVRVPPQRSAPNDFVNSGQQNFVSDIDTRPSPFSTVGQMSPNQRLRELAKFAAHESAKGDKKQAAMMESIFADTAMTTLQSQLGSELGSTGGMYLNEEQAKKSEEIDQAELQALNGNRPTNHWAALAFGKYQK